MDKTNWTPKHWKCKQKHPKVFLQLAQLCAQIVFIIWGWASKMQMCAENTIKIVVSTKPKQPPNMTEDCQSFKVWNWSKHKSKTGPSMLCNMLGPILDLWKWSILNILGGHFFEKSHSPCRKKNINRKSKNGERRRKLGPIFDLYKANLGPIFDSTAYIYILVLKKKIYIYIYIHCFISFNVSGYVLLYRVSFGQTWFLRIILLQE